MLNRNRSERYSTSSTTSTLKAVISVLHEDSSARSVTAFPQVYHNKRLKQLSHQLQLRDHEVMDTYPNILQVEDEEGGLVYDNTSDEGQNLTQESTGSHEMTSRDYHQDTGTDHNDINPPFVHFPAPTQQLNSENITHFDDDELYPLSNTPPLSLTPSKSLASKKVIDGVLQGLPPPPPPTSIDQGTGSEMLEANMQSTILLAAMSSSATENVTGDETHNPNISIVRGGSGGGKQRHHRQPSIYSAIGSLEDPLSRSLKGWEHDTNSSSRSDGSSAKVNQRKSNYEFPSMTTTLLAPQSHVAAKKRSLLDASMIKQTRKVDNIALKQPPESQQLKLHGGTPSSNSEDVDSNAIKVANINDNNEIITESAKNKIKGDKKVTLDPSANVVKTKARRSSSRKLSNKNNAPIEMFRPSSDAYTPRMGKKEIKYKPAAMRTPVQQMASPLGTLSRPNFRDALRRVAMIIHQHIVKIERRFEQHRPINSIDDLASIESNLSYASTAGGRGYGRRYHRHGKDDGLFSTIMRETFSEDRYITPRYKCTMVRVPMALAGMVCGLKQIREIYEIPTENEIYEFAHQLFKSVQLSSECSIVGLIYVERLMEAAKVPLLAETWRPIFMCGLLMASKVWQDLSSWNIEFASVYPRYSLESINRLELQFLRMIKWDLYISSSQYAKYYFALRSLVEKPDFRQRYNRMVGGVNMVQASQALKIEERSTMVKEEAILHLSRSM